MSIKAHERAAYLGWGPPALIGYYPAWLDNMADDVTLDPHSPQHPAHQ
jgi:hypothetical protein